MRYEKAKQLFYTRSAGRYVKKAHVIESFTFLREDIL